jgi:hypothetical protein
MASPPRIYRRSPSCLLARFVTENLCFITLLVWLCAVLSGFVTENLCLSSPFFCRAWLSAALLPCPVAKNLCLSAIFFPTWLFAAALLCCQKSVSLSTMYLFVLDHLSAAMLCRRESVSLCHFVSLLGYLSAVLSCFITKYLCLSLLFFCRAWLSAALLPCSVAENLFLSTIFSIFAWLSVCCLAFSPRICVSLRRFFSCLAICLLLHVLVQSCNMPFKSTTIEESVPLFENHQAYFW